MGISGFYFFYALFLHGATGSGGWVGVALAVAALVISVYESYVGYLVWFRWSPLAVRQVTGVLAFLVWTLAAAYAPHESPAGTPDWMMMAPMAGLVILYAGYRWLTAYWCERLFPFTTDAASLPSQA